MLISNDIREAIHSGAYPVGEWLPAPGKLAAHFHTTTNTLNIAFNRLMREGYLERKRGQGWKVISREPATAEVRWTSRVWEPGELLDALAELEQAVDNARLHATEQGYCHPAVMGRIHACEMQVQLLADRIYQQR